MDPQAWAAFAAASLVLLAVPGPMVLMVVASVLGRGTRAALPLACGTALGDATMMTLALAGVGAILATSEALLAGLRWAGAAYLAWLGVAMWRAGAGGPASPDAPLDAPLAGASLRLAGQAWLAVVLNPLSTGFFLAFVPQFIDPARAFWGQVLILEATFMGLAFGNTLAYGLLAGRLGRAAGGGSGTWARGARRLGGATLVALGVLTLTA